MAALDAVRERIRALDAELGQLVARRVEAAREAGRIKRAEHLALRDYGTEREVVARIRDAFTSHQLDPETGETLARVLIHESLRAQEADGLEVAEASRGRALVVGGAGKMGRWFVGFMNAMGYEVRVHDPSGGVDGFADEPDLPGGVAASDIVVLATPPRETAALLELATEGDALVFDIASLKAPFQDTLAGLAEAGARVTSVHPLWGPRTRVLSGKNLLVLDCGNADAADEAAALFGGTAAEQHRLPLAEHDPLMALTLGLPHLVNLAYAEVLATSGRAFETLRGLGGPTFLKQTDVAAEVASENPELYRQIQQLNQGAGRTHDALHRALETIAARVEDPDGFRTAMLSYRAYFGDYQRGLRL